MRPPEQPQPVEIDPQRNRRERIRLLSKEAHLAAIDAIIKDGGRHIIDSQNEDPDIWVTSTSTLRTLVAAGVPFEWETKPR